MRNALVSLVVMAVAVVAVILLLPVLGFLLLAVAVVVALAIGAFLAAPLLAKLPWFRDRIHVDEEGGRRSVRFGRGFYTSSYTGSYRGSESERANPFETPVGHLDDGDVIDVEAREIPDKDPQD